MSDRGIKLNSFQSQKNKFAKSSRRAVLLVSVSVSLCLSLQFSRCLGSNQGTETSNDAIRPENYQFDGNLKRVYISFYHLNLLKNDTHGS